MWGASDTSSSMTGGPTFGDAPSSCRSILEATTRCSSDSIHSSSVPNLADSSRPPWSVCTRHSTLVRGRPRTPTVLLSHPRASIQMNTHGTSSSVTGGPRCGGVPSSGRPTHEATMLDFLDSAHNSIVPKLACSTRLPHSVHARHPPLLDALARLCDSPRLGEPLPSGAVLRRRERPHPLVVRSLRPTPNHHHTQRTASPIPRAVRWSTSQQYRQRHSWGNDSLHLL